MDRVAAERARKGWEKADAVRSMLAPRERTGLSVSDSLGQSIYFASPYQSFDFSRRQGDPEARSMKPSATSVLKFDALCRLFVLHRSAQSHKNID